MAGRRHAEPDSGSSHASCLSVREDQEDGRVTVYLLKDPPAMLAANLQGCRSPGLRSALQITVQRFWGPKGLAFRNSEEQSLLQFPKCFSA